MYEAESRVAAWLRYCTVQHLLRRNIVAIHPTRGARALKEAMHTTGESLSPTSGFEDSTIQDRQA
jgi:hypothetical protein